MHFWKVKPIAFNAKPEAYSRSACRGHARNFTAVWCVAAVNATPPGLPVGVPLQVLAVGPRLRLPSSCVLESVCQVGAASAGEQSTQASAGFNKAEP
ncbi:hypothetical protein N9B17_02950 [Rhodopirellula sp.]|nr:hypothetical protein [Rhodopirellula sp.]